MKEKEGRDESDDRFENEASVRLGHKSLRTLMKRSSSWYLPGWSLTLHLLDLSSASLSLKTSQLHVSLSHCCKSLANNDKLHWDVMASGVL